MRQQTVQAGCLFSTLGTQWSIDKQVSVSFAQRW